MKRIFLFLAMSSVLLAACSEKNLYPVAYINEAEGSTFTPAEVSAYGTTLTVSFNTNYTWQIQGWSTLTFCSLDVLKGESGTGTVTVKVLPNTTDELRTDSFDIVAGAARKTVTITQTETNAIDIGTTTYTASAAGGIVEIAVSSNIEYTVNIPSEITWIREAPTKAMSDSYINLVVDASREWAARTASITVTGKNIDGKDISVPITITQDAAEISIPWTKSFSTDWTSIGTTSPLHLAVYDGSLLVSNATEIHSINQETGDYIGKADISGLSVAPESMASDNAGNLLFAANANNTMFTVYMYDGTSVTSLAEYNGANINGWTIGNLRVVGDVKSDAVITAIATLWSNPTYYIAWQVTGGVAGDAVTGKITPTNYPSNILYACVSPVSDNLNDGLVFCGYAGDPYALYYCADPVSAKEWTTVYDFNGAWNTNFSCISVAQYNGKRYCAVGESWFGGNTPTVFLLDITDIPNVSLAYQNTFSGVWEASPDANDVKISVEDDIMRLFVVNSLSDMASCVEFPH